MIFQGLFNILDLYFEEIGEFYHHIDKYFRETISRSMESMDLKDFTYNNIFEGITTTLKKEFIELGFEQDIIENYFMDRALDNDVMELDKITSTFEIYENKFAPIVYEIFLEQIVDYLVEDKAVMIILNLKSKGFFPTEFILELRNLKQLMQKSPDKVENLKKYIHIQDHIQQKIDAFAEVMAKILEEGKTNPELVQNAPHTTPVKRLDEVKAARDMDFCWKSDAF